MTDPTGTGGFLPQVPLEPLHDDDPRQVGSFRLLGRLGSGGMGVAFLAESGGHWAVVKVVRPELADHPGFRPRLARELEAMRLTSGAHTAVILDADLEANRPWFAMEFIPGVTLARRVSADGPLSTQEVLDLARGLADVLDAVHSAGVIHRDLKPSNIMLSPTGPRLIDFGIAELADGTQLTTVGTVVGSTGWLAAEQITGDPVTTATDIHAWALCVLYAATGSQPFGGDNTGAAIYRVLETTPPVPNTIPQPLHGLLVSALSKAAVQRPPLTRIREELGGSPPARSAHPRESAPTVLPAPVGRASSAGQFAPTAANIAVPAQPPATGAQRSRVAIIGIVMAVLAVAVAGTALAVTVVGGNGDGATGSAAPAAPATATVTTTATARPTPTPTESPTRKPKPRPTSAQTSISYWQSPSGNLRCAYFPQGTAGQTVACLDGDTNQLVRLSSGLVRFSAATSSQRAQLPGGRVIDFGDPARSFGTLPDGSPRFTCWLSPDGMTCDDNEQGAWFVIRRGYVDGRD